MQLACAHIMQAQMVGGFKVTEAHELVYDALSVSSSLEAVQIFCKQPVTDAEWAHQELTTRIKYYVTDYRKEHKQALMENDRQGVYMGMQA